MKNKRILFIAPSSYPIFGAEANVNAKVIKILSEAGYKVDVISRIQKGAKKNYPISKDDYFFGKANSINLIPLDTGKNLKTIINHFKSFLKFGYFYKGIDWAYFASIKCEKLITQKKYDYILTKNEPSEVVGLYLSKKYNLKWIPTWNDPYIWNKYPYPYGKNWNAKTNFFRKKLIKEICKHASAHIFPSERLKEYMLRYMIGMNKDNCVIIPHALLQSAKQNQQREKKDVLKIIHAGELGKERNPETFLTGLKEFILKAYDPKIEVTFVGTYARQSIEYFQNLVAKLELNQYIKTLDPIPYNESLNIISHYDICLIIEAPCEEGIFLPSKVVDYLQCEKKIFSVSPKIGTLNDLYSIGIVDYFADVSDAKEISSVINSIYNEFIGDFHFTEKDISFFLDENILKNYELLLT